MKLFPCTILILVVCIVAQAQPFEPVVIWDRSGPGSQSGFGARVYPLGDQNLDGFQDFATISWGTWPPNQPSEARFDFFYGGNPPSQEPYLTFRQSSDPPRLDMNEGILGDLNGDGFVDWFVQYYIPDIDSALVNIYTGGAEVDTIPILAFYIGTVDIIGSLGDFNGDGFDDIYIYRSSGDTNYTDILFGSEFPDVTPDLRLYGNPPNSSSAYPRSFGDINGDGFDDFITTTSPIDPVTRIYLGSADPDTMPDYIWNGYHASPVSMIDLNGDGKKDIVVGQGITWTSFWAGTRYPMFRIFNCFLRVVQTRFNP